MFFRIFMFAMSGMVPFTMIGFGRMFLKGAPKNVNSVFGYRTVMSMKNKEAWEFAHRYFGKLWYVWGLVLLPPSIIPMFFAAGRDKDTVGYLGVGIVIAQMIPFLGAILPTERALRRNFDKDGRVLKKKENIGEEKRIDE